MPTSLPRRSTFVVLVVTLLLSPALLGMQSSPAGPLDPQGPTALVAAGRGQGATFAQGANSTLLVLYEDRNYPFRVPAARGYGAARVLAPTATINVSYVPNGGKDYTGNTCINFPTDARNAFDYAASIWEGYVASAVPITIQACWRNMGSTSILGSSAVLTYSRDFTGAPVPSTWYQIALANALAGSDLDGGPSGWDMLHTYNSTFAWHYDPATSPDPGEVDFASVALHEIGHGLGFAGSMSVDNGSGGAECDGTSGHGCWGWGSGYPVVYDRFTESTAGVSLLNTGTFPQNSTALGNQLKISGGNWFDGPFAYTANGSARVGLYTPTTWTPGSSYSHVAESYNGTANALMTYSIAAQEQIHDPGPVTLGVLRDLGWVMDREPSAWLPLIHGAEPTATWTTIVSEGFEGTFPGVWTVLDNDGATNGTYYWGKRTCQAFSGSNSGWAVGGGTNGSALSCGADYPNNAQSWMVYGPFSLVGATAADLSFFAWLQTPNDATDVLGYMASTNGANFYGYMVYGDTNGWASGVLDLAAVPTGPSTTVNLLGQPSVWVALAFNSNGSTRLAEGAYVDDILVRKCTFPSCPTSLAAGPVTGKAQLTTAPIALILPD